MSTCLTVVLGLFIPAEEGKHMSSSTVLVSSLFSTSVFLPTQASQRRVQRIMFDSAATKQLITNLLTCLEQSFFGMAFSFHHLLGLSRSICYALLLMLGEQSYSIVIE